MSFYELRGMNNWKMVNFIAFTFDLQRARSGWKSHVGGPSSWSVIADAHSHTPEEVMSFMISITPLPLIGYFVNFNLKNFQWFEGFFFKFFRRCNFARVSKFTDKKSTPFFFPQTTVFNLSPQFWNAEKMKREFFYFSQIARNCTLKFIISHK